jgi:hypothetical protein
MKRFAVSSLAATCGLLLATTAHASFVEKSFVDDPAWKTQDQVDAASEARVDARTAVPSGSVQQHNDVQQEDESDFNETDSGGDVEFGRNIRLNRLDFSPSAPVTRAEFTAMLVRSRYSQGSIDSCYWDITSVWPPKFELLFRDVPVDHAYAPEICVAMRDGLVRGYGNDVFRPDAQITFADAAKIIARAEGLTPWADSGKPAHWFDPYVQALAARNAIPLSVQTLEERITGGEAMEIMDRLAENDRSKPSRTAEQLISAWEKTYAPRPRPVIPARPAMMGPVNNPARPSSATSAKTASSATSASSVSSRKSAASVSSHATTSAMTSESSSRPKAWYEF